MSYQNNKTWRKRHPVKWQKGKQRYYKQFEKEAYNTNQQWTIKDMNLIVKRNASDRILSKQLGRSVKAIQIKRARLNNFKNNKNIV